MRQGLVSLDDLGIEGRSNGPLRRKPDDVLMFSPSLEATNCLTATLYVFTFPSTATESGVDVEAPKMRTRSIIVLLVLAGLTAALAPGAAFGKAHVPADEVQVSHKARKAINVDAPALRAHMRHGDLQLPACDFNNVFLEGDDTSNVISSDDTGVTYSDRGFVPRDSAEGITPACPPGTF